MDVLRAVLPAGTLSGAPKVRAMEIIDELEPHKRGSYGGAIGYLSYTGDLDTAIHIRTVVVKDGMVHVQAGGGTVADAKPAYEYSESREQGQGGLPRGRARRRAAGVAMSARVLVIDNYDSFTYNLVQYLGELGARGRGRPQRRGDRRRAARARPDRLVVSPGPCTPAEPGSRSRRSRASPRPAIPVLGVCLGHQSLVEAFGGKAILGEPIHGKDAEVEHDGSGIYEGLPSPLRRRAATTR